MRRLRGMRNPTTPRRLLGLVVVAGLAVTACGSDDDSSEPAVVPAADDTLPPVDEPSDEPDPDDAVSSDDPLPTDDLPPAPDFSDLPDDAIGAGNIGGEIVDPQPHAIDEILIAESYPEQLMVSFTAGDPNCTAATAIAIGTPDEVRVELTVGITTDALTKSCMAGDFEHTIGIALDEGLDGRPVVTS